MTYRVVGWSTGGVGQLAIRAIARRPDLDLVGVWVHSAEKDGVDAGHAGGHRPDRRRRDDRRRRAARARARLRLLLGVGRGDGRRRGARRWRRMLEAGINVVTVSTPGLVHPAGYQAGVARPARGRPRRRATRRSTRRASSPASPVTSSPLTLMTHERHRARRCARRRSSATTSYPVTFVMFEVFGFGKPMEHQAIMAMPGVQSGSWGPPVRMIADRLGVELDEIRETYEKVVTPRTLEVAAGTIEAGTVGAVRFETIGVVDGRDAIVIEHVNRMAPRPRARVADRVARRHLPDRDRGQPRPHLRAHRRAARDRRATTAWSRPRCAS